MRKRVAGILGVSLLGGVLVFPSVAAADCAALLSVTANLHSALVAAVVAETSGLNNNMWATIVDRDGIVCSVVFSGVDRHAEWPGSRVISAQKANTANVFSLDSSSSSTVRGKLAAWRCQRLTSILPCSPAAACMASSTAILSTLRSRMAAQ